MDDFERAIVLLYDQSPGTDPGLKEQARVYCDSLRTNPDIWQLCMQRFGSSGYAEVQFWCLQTLQQSLEAKFASIPKQHQDLIKQTLMSWTEAVNNNQLQPFLRNKLAQVIVLVLREQYPAEWPSVFHDLIAVAQASQGAVDMLCRILASLDEDVISLEVPRDQKAMQAATEIKDAMRERCLPALVHACYQLAVQLQGGSPGLAAGLLQAISRFINWIDISLVANEQYVSLMTRLLQGSNPELQSAAADVLLEIASKRMDPAAKLAMLQHLGVGDTCAAWAAALNPADSGSDPDLALKCAQLLSTLATEVLEAWKRLENSLVSMAAVGLQVSHDAASETEAACSAAQGMLATLFPPVLGLLDSSDSDIALAAVPLLGSYINKLKLGLKRTNNVMPEAQRQHMSAILQAIMSCARYPDDLGPDEIVPEETVLAVTERRLELFVLLKNAVRVASEDAYSFASMQLQNLLSRPEATFQEVEVVVAVIYELGEGASEAAFKPGSGALANLSMALFRAVLPRAGHPLVSGALLECYVRYSRVLSQEKSLLPHVLSVFLGAHGIGHKDEAVATRACYLLCRLIKALRSELQAHLAEVLRGLQPHLARIITTPPPQSLNATKAAIGSIAASSMDDRLYAYEAAGLLLGQEDLPAEQQLAALEGVIGPLLVQIDRQLPLAAPQRTSQGTPGQIYPPPGADPQAASAQVQQALEGLTRLAKGLSLNLCTRTRPQIGELLHRPLRAALQVPLAVPGDKALRTRVLSFLHRMVESLGPHLLPMLPSAVRSLLPADSQAPALTDVLALLHQLAVRYKAALEPLMSEAFPKVVTRFSELLPAGWDWSASKGGALAATEGSTSEDAREFAESQKGLYSLMSALVLNSLGHVLLKVEESSLQMALTAVVEGAASHVETGTRRTCTQILRGVAAELAKAGPQGAGTHRFLLESCVGRAGLQGLTAGTLDAKDAGVHGLLTDTAALLLQVGRICGPELAQFLQASAAPALGISDQMPEILRALAAQDQKQLKGALLAIVASVQLTTRMSNRSDHSMNGHMDFS